MQWVKKLLVGIAIFLCLLMGFGLAKGANQPIALTELRNNTKTHYLIDQEYRLDPANLLATSGHLLVFNPGDRAAKLKLTLYFEDEAPKTFALQAPAQTSSESNYDSWAVTPKPNQPFALQVESSRPVVCQATLGWTNTNNNYKLAATTRSPKGVRETAKSYMAINQLAHDWFVADGIVINQPDKLWLKESEWALLLNPSDQPTAVTLVLYYGKAIVRHQVTVPAQRLKRILMDDLVQQNQHYGARIVSNRPIVAQWLRTVNWYDSPELMATWTVPAVAAEES